jgi:hypothetical protein
MRFVLAPAAFCGVNCGGGVKRKSGVNKASSIGSSTEKHFLNEYLTELTSHSLENIKLQHISFILLWFFRAEQRRIANSLNNMSLISPDRNLYLTV